MSDEAKKVQVAIEATSNLPQTAAKDTEALKGVGKEAGDTAGKLERLKKHTDSNLPQTAAKDAEALKGVGKAAGDTTEQLELLKKPTDELRRITSDLDRALPGLGEGFRILRGGALGAIGGIIIGFVELRESIKQADEALNQMAQNNAQADFLPNIEDKIQVYADAATAAQAYADKLNQIATGAQSVNDKLKNQLDLDQAIERAQAELTSAQKGLEIARIQQDEATNKITPEKAAEERAAVEKKYIEQEKKDRDDAIQQQLKDKQAQLDEDKKNAGDLAKKQKEADDQVTKDEAHQAGIKGDLPRLHALLADAQRELDAADARARAQMYRGDPNAANLSDAEREAIRKINEDASHITDVPRTNVNRIQQQINQATAGGSAEALAKIQADKDAAKVAKQQNDESSTQLRKLTDEIAQLNKTLAAIHDREQQTMTAKEQTVDAEETARMAKQFQEDFKTLTEFNRAKNPSGTLIEAVKKAIDDMTAMQQDNLALIQTFQSYGPAIAALQADTARLKSQQQRAPQNSFSY